MQATACEIVAARGQGLFDDLQEGVVVQDSVADAILHGIQARREVLTQLTREQRAKLLEILFIDFFGDQHTVMQKWAALTGQSAQVDTGYIAQFVASIALQIPGQGFRGKGDDLADGSEVKSAANVSGVDRPRWNHNLGTVAQDEKRRKEGKPTVGDEYLSVPYVFYLLADRSATDINVPRAIRIRAWLIDAQQDLDWRSLVIHYLETRTGNKYNLQLHPPVGYDDNIVVNTLGNLDFTDVLLFDARLVRRPDGAVLIEWNVPLPENVIPVEGRTRRFPYGGRGARPSRLTDAGDLVADIAGLPRLFPDILGREQEARLEESSRQEAKTAEPNESA